MENLKELAELILPEGILEYFEYTGYETIEKEITISLVEKNKVPQLPDKYRDRRIRQKGFKQITINDFPIRGKKVRLLLRRRVWQIEGETELYKKEIPSQIFPGTKLSKDFADFLKEEIEKRPIEISTVARANKLKANTLEKQYKNVLSTYSQFKRDQREQISKESFVYPENFREDMAIDETGLINEELYTIVINKTAKGKKGSLAAIIKGTKSSIITREITESVGFEKLVKIKEITLDLSNSMDWSVRQIAPNGIHTYDRFHVQKIVSDAVQTLRIRLRWQAIEEENEALLKAKELKVKYESKVFRNGDSRKQLLARSRYFLFKPSNKWTDTQRQRSEILFKEYPELLESYNLSMYFRKLL
ncbi:MAG: transposase [Melioribacteraceae bacterium]|nr:transposase [Melioribacteraceae bacterium]